MHAETNRRTAFLFLSPALALLAAVLGAPAAYSIVLSLQNASTASLLQGDSSFVGLANFVTLAQDGIFLNSVWLGLVFTLLTTGIELLIAVAVALYLEHGLRVPRFVEVLLILPMFVIPVVSGLTFRYLFDASEGVVAHVFAMFGKEAPGILDDPILAFGAIMAQDVWRMWPFVFLVVYAGLKTLPRGPLEAARLDGATYLQSVRFIILPMLMPTLTVAALLKVVESLKAFTEIYVMTGGGPGESTSLFSLFIVRQAFTHFNLSYASAASVALFVAGALLALALGFSRHVREKATP